MRLRSDLLAPIALCSVMLLASCGDDSGNGSSSADGAGSTSAGGAITTGTAGGSGTTGAGADASDAAPTSEGPTTTANPVVPDAQATAGLVQTAVQMKLLTASVQAGEATDAAFQGVFDGWDAYDGTIQKNDPAAWQALTDSLGAMRQAVVANDAAAAEAAAATFEAAVNGYLASA